MTDALRKTSEEIAIMREGGKILAGIQAKLTAAVRPGVSSLDLDSLAASLFRDVGVKPSFLGYDGYPNSICVSVNEEVVHGIPRPDRVLAVGDLVGLDLGVLHRGFHTDTAVTVPVGRVSREAKKLLRVTKEALEQGIRAARAGNTTSDIGSAIEAHVRKAGFQVVQQLIGHGIGRRLHEDPPVPNFPVPGHGVRLVAGMTIAIEPMVNVGTEDVKTLADGWTIVTADGSRSAHFEHTVAITDGAPAILTAP